MPKCHVMVPDSDEEELTRLLHRSNLKSKVFKRVIALPELNKGKSIEAVRGISGLCYPC